MEFKFKEFVDLNVQIILTVIDNMILEIEKQNRNSITIDELLKLRNNIEKEMVF